MVFISLQSSPKLYFLAPLSCSMRKMNESKITPKLNLIEDNLLFLRDNKHRRSTLLVHG